MWVDVLFLSGESFLFIFLALPSLSCDIDSLRWTESDSDYSVRFEISEEDLASGPESRLDHSGLLCGGSFITVKVAEKASDTDIGRGGRGRTAPRSLVFGKGIIYFLTSYYSKSKECPKLVEILPDSLPQFTF